VPISDPNGRFLITIKKLNMTPIFSIFFIIAVIISTSVLIIILISQHKPQQFRKILSRFKRAAAESGISIAKQELIGKRVIGVDTENGKLLFFSTAGNKHEGYFVDLYDIKSVEVNKEYGLTFDKYSRKKIAETDVSKIALHLFYKNGAKRLVLPFYDNMDERPSDVLFRLHQAKEWRDLLSSISARDGRMPGKCRMTAFRTYADAA
jgi:hypothetical protein